MPDDLDSATAALLRYLYDDHRHDVGVGRLVEMGMVTAPELANLLAELARRRLARASSRYDNLDARITKAGIAWVRRHYDDIPPP